MKMIQFRPHHFLCTLGFVGKGYSDEFTRNYSKIVATLNGPEGDETDIEIVSSTDSVCSPCPNRRDTLCTTQEKISKLDQAHAAVLNLRPGEQIKWGEAKKRIRKEFTQERFDSACAPCGWKSLGVCEAALKRLQQSSPVISLALACTLLSQSAFASVVSSPAQFGEQVRQELTRKRRSSALLQFSKSWEKSVGGQLNEAINLPPSLVKNPLYSSYAPVVRAESSLRAARRAINKKSPDRATSLAKSAASACLELFTEHPEQAGNHPVDECLGQADLIAGEAAALKKNRASTKRLISRSLVRLGTRTFTRLASLNAVTEFAKACSASPDALCSQHIQDLISRYPAKSAEALAILKYQPKDESPAQQMDPGFEPRTIPYRSPDRDVVAANEAISIHIQGDPKKAIDLYRKFLDEFPKSSERYRVRYWLARAIEARGNLEHATAIYEGVMRESPLSYYGLVSSFAIKQPLDSKINAELPPVSTSDPALKATELASLQRAETFLANALPDLASRELKSLRVRREMSGPFLSYLALLNHDAKNHLQAFIIISDLIQRGDNSPNTSFGLRKIFPISHQKTIEKHAQERGLDPVLVISLIKQESALNPDAVSSVGALGLMQLMPFTAVDVDASVEQRRILNPDVNVSLGTRYLSQMIERFGGNVAFALAAYNAGPHRMAKWKNELKKGWSITEFIESIPFQETRGYVAGIARNYYWYSQRINGTRVENLNYFWPEESR